MNDNNSTVNDGWNEEASTTFINFGRYFVPDRENQMDVIADLTAHFTGPHTILELACGEGLLAEVLLERSNNRSVIGLDRSLVMRQHAEVRNARFGERFGTRPFNLASTKWRESVPPIHAVVSSLAIHHLDDLEKQGLFQDIFRMLMPGGLLAIADLNKPLHPQGWVVAANAWDQAVKERSLDLAGDERAFRLFEKEHWNMFKYFDPEDIDKPSSLPDQLMWLNNAGFESVDVYWMKAGHAIYGGWKPEMTADETEQ